MCITLDLPLRVELALVAAANAHHYNRLLELAANCDDPFQLPEPLLRRECPHARWPSRLQKREFRALAEQIVSDLARGGYFRIAWEDAAYPELLRQIHSPPAQLFARGRCELLRHPLWGIVGTRRASRDGADTCRRFAATLVEEGVTVVSGLAQGIDTAAHQGALTGSAHLQVEEHLDAGPITQAGGTVAVLGTGLDRNFPAQNRRLQQRIAEEGLLLTEFPPQTAVQGANFPRRNRIVAGICSGVLAGEAPLRSGALITARLALEENRDVYSVPGCIGDKRYAGNLHLLQQGALLAIEPEDILSALAIDRSTRPAKAAPLLPPLTLEQATVMDCLSQESKLHIDQLLRRTGLQRGDLALLLMDLELAGHLRQLPGQYISAAI